MNIKNNFTVEKGLFMKKSLILSVSLLTILLASSLTFAKDGKSNGRWCNKTDGDFAGDCSDAGVHCAPGWGLDAGTCEYAVGGDFVAGGMGTNALPLKAKKIKQIKTVRKENQKPKSKPAPTSKN